MYRGRKEKEIVKVNLNFQNKTAELFIGKLMCMKYYIHTNLLDNSKS